MDPRVGSTRRLAALPHTAVVVVAAASLVIAAGCSDRAFESSSNVVPAADLVSIDLGALPLPAVTTEQLRSGRYASAVGEVTMTTGPARPGCRDRQADTAMIDGLVVPPDSAHTSSVIGLSARQARALARGATSLTLGATPHATIRLQAPREAGQHFRLVVESGSTTDSFDVAEVQCQPLQLLPNAEGAVALSAGDDLPPRVSVDGHRRPVETLLIPGAGLRMTFIPGDDGERAFVEIGGERFSIGLGSPDA